MQISYSLNKKIHYVNFLDGSSKKLVTDLEKLNSDKKILFVFDSNINNKFIEDIYSNLKFSGCKIYKLKFKGNKKNKSFKSVLKILDFFIKEGFTKKSVLICLGGGVLGDICGLASCLYMRGMIYFNIPSTITSMIDSCIGGKTGINYQNIINSAGTFYHANSVYIFMNLLNSLPEREFLSGIPEILKCGLIKKNKILNLLKSKKHEILKRNKTILKMLFSETLKTKIHFFINDVYEEGPRLMLNFGHTFAHSLEMSTANITSNYDYMRHGEAVGIGLLCELDYVNGRNKIYKSVIKILEAYSLPVSLKQFKIVKPYKLQNEIFKNIFLDKKKVNNNPRIISLKKIGYPKILEMKNYDKINEVINSIV